MYNMSAFCEAVLAGSNDRDTIQSTSSAVSLLHLACSSPTFVTPLLDMEIVRVAFESSLRASPITPGGCESFSLSWAWAWHISGDHC